MKLTYWVGKVVGWWGVGKEGNISFFFPAFKALGLEG